MTRRRVVTAVILLALAGLGWCGYLFVRTWREVPYAYAAWDAGTLLVEYLETHDNHWPKSWDEVRTADAKFWQMPYRWDDVVGVSLSLGLITTGVVILAFRVLALRGQSLAIGCLSVALVYSTLLNVGMVSAYFNVTKYLVEQLERQGQMTKTRTPVLLGDESLVLWRSRCPIDGVQRDICLLKVVRNRLVW